MKRDLKGQKVIGYSQRGFTLVELLVVIGIVAILVAVVSTAASSAIASANRAKCQSNLKQIGIALFAYAADNNGDLPQTSTYGGIQFGETDNITHKPGWVEQLDPYTSTNHNLFKCPANPYKNAPSNYFLCSWAAFYANNQNFPTPPLHLISSLQPAAQILVGDATFSTQQNDADPDDAFGAGLDPGGLLANKPSRFWHRGKTNILFFDGHVEAVSGFDKTTMTSRYEGIGYDYKSVSPNPP